MAGLHTMPSGKMERRPNISRVAEIDELRGQFSHRGRFELLHF